MIELSHANVLNGFAKMIHMQVWSRNMVIGDYVFNRAVDLYYRPNHDKIGFYVKRADRTLEIQYTAIRFKSWDGAKNDSWRGFRGVQMIHPELSLNFHTQKDFDLYDEMKFHNERYLDSWQP